MDNKAISDLLKLTGQLMELHGENEFKIRSYNNAAFRIGKLALQLSQMNPDDLENVEGIGKSIASKIAELLETNNMQYLQEMLAKTPRGVVEMLSVKGIGPKKIKVLWNELAVESMGELLYACNENRLAGLKGFGQKTQETIRKSIEFIISSTGKYHYAAAESLAGEIIDILKNETGSSLVSLTGKMRRKCEIVEGIDILIASEQRVEKLIQPHEYLVPVNIITCLPHEFYTQLFLTTGHKRHFEASGITVPAVKNFSSESEIYSQLNIPYIVPEMREGLFEFEWIRKNSSEDLIEMNDLMGILHNHSTYSDGIHSLREMAEHCKALGYEYLGICDHSKSATYANGLNAERVAEQQKEADLLNATLAPFRIFKGIESDILNDGSLDYPDEILKNFDFIVASVHSNLKMTEEKATARLIKAIENPYTTILGHPTGRLLLSREGYPIDHKKVIEACAANQVVIELNAHPYRLDLDWRWIQYAISQNVMISINPDAHHKEGYHDMYYGVCVARKGGLTKKMTFNTKSKVEMEEYFRNKKPST